MSFTNVHIGDTEELRVLKDDDIIGFTFTVTNSDSSAYDFTGFTDQNLYIWSDAAKTTLVKTILAADLGISSNVITWTSDYSATLGSATALTLGLYYYNLTYEDSTNRPITVLLGNFRLV